MTKIKTIISIVLLILYGLCCNMYMEGDPMLLNWLGIFILVVALYTWKLKHKSSFFSPYTIFFIFFFLFNYGQCVMWAFNIHSPREIGVSPLWNISIIPQKIDIARTQWYVCLAMFFFHCGAMLAGKWKNRYIVLNTAKFESDVNLSFVSMKKVSRFLLCIIAPIALYNQFQTMIIAQLYGYRALYYGEHAGSGYMQILMFLFFPTLVCFLIGNKYSIKSRRIVYSIFGLYTLLGILSGDRGGWLFSLVVLIWIHTHYEGITKRTAVKLGVIGLVGLFFLSAITAVRNDGLNITSDIFVNAVKAENNALVDAFFEMGGTMSIITYLLNASQDIYPYTNTYLVAILGALSSKMLSLFGLKQVLLGDWFSQQYLGLSDWGVGFSMLGEAYINGGYFGGLIYMMIIGFIIGKAISYISNLFSNNNPIGFFMGASCLNFLIYFPRGASYLTIKEFVYGTFFIYIIVVITKRYYKKRIAQY